MGKMVKCIYDGSSGTGYLVAGQVYEVERELLRPWSTTPQYKLEGVNGEWNKTRFVDVAPASKTDIVEAQVATSVPTTPAEPTAPKFDFDSYNRTLPGGIKPYSMDRAITRHTK